jgi:hypothetical protein
MGDILSAIYTSEAACNSIARRAIREREKNMTESLNTALRILYPALSRIANKSKIGRGELRPLVHRAYNALGEVDGMITLTAKVIVPPPSSDESYVLQFIQASGWEESIVAFTSTSIELTRKRCYMLVNAVPIIVNAHVMSRYMQRESKDVISFYHEIMRPIKLATVFASRKILKAADPIALPFASGLLFGNVGEAFRDGSKFFMEVMFHHTETQQLGDGDMRRLLDMRTFVNYDAFYDNQDALFRLMTQFEQKYSAEINNIYESHLFGDTYDISSEKAFDAAQLIVNNPAYLDFARRRKNIEKE